jgi:hypothetical protein
MDAGFFADLTVDLNDRRSSRTDRLVQAVFAARSSPVWFSGGFIGDVHDGSRAQPVCRRAQAESAN